MRKAMGTVSAIVNVPHALSDSALTTTMPKPASAMMSVKRIAMPAATPAAGLISRATIAASKVPSRVTAAPGPSVFRLASALHRSTPEGWRGTYGETYVGKQGGSLFHDRDARDADRGMRQAQRRGRRHHVRFDGRRYPGDLSE